MKTSSRFSRPKKLDQFIGKPTLIKSIKTGLKIAKKLNKPFDHCLFYGPPGVGKTTLANIIANEMKAKIKVVQSVNLQSFTDLVTLLSNIQDNDVIFIDEIHSLNSTLTEILYPAIEDNKISLMIGKKFNAKIVQLKLPKFTLIGATTHLGMINKALEERFAYSFYIDEYSDEEIHKLILITMSKYDFQLKDKEIDLILKNSRKIPRNCLKILKRIYDYKSLQEKVNVADIIKEIGYIYQGLTIIDLKYLSYLKTAINWTASLKSIEQAINIDQRTILEKIEPFLIKEKYVQKSSKGRFLTNKGFDLLQENKNLILK